jgi:hypothetical protein
MSDRLTVVATRNGGPGKPEELGTIDRGGFWWSGNDAVLGLRGGTELMQLIQIDGSAGRGFHLVDGGMMFLDCRIVGSGGPGNLYKLLFMRTAPAPLP